MLFLGSFSVRQERSTRDSQKANMDFMFLTLSLILEATIAIPVSAQGTFR